MIDLYVRDYSGFVWNQAEDEEKIEAKKKIGIICLLSLDEKKEKCPWLEEEWIKKIKKVGQNANDLFKMLTSFHDCVDDWMYASSHSMSKSMSSHSWLILKVDKSEDLEEETQVSEIPFLRAF